MEDLKGIYKHINSNDQRITILETQANERFSYINDSLETIGGKVDIIVSKFACLESIIDNKITKALTIWVLVITAVAGAATYIALHFNVYKRQGHKIIRDNGIHIQEPEEIKKGSVG